ncbi:MAG TPA: nuclear transport factor 2 family protein [Actinomycetota bacterium]|nr:nuclear transport factor 2 family protein [Actinomycetota bacterium]
MGGNAELIETFYAAFARKDGDTMASCYRADASFSDPVFPHLSAEEAGAMWRMFCRPDSDLTVTFRDVRTEDDHGSAHWSAEYTFPPTGRKVRNEIDAEFSFAGGKIVSHRDEFDFFRWSRMALGAPGYLLGWSPLVRSKVRGQAASQLRRFMESEGGPATRNGA